MGIIATCARHLLALVSISIAASSFAQTAAQVEQFKNMLNEKGHFDFKRATSEGKFRGCELTYRKLFRDYRAHKGEVVAAYGSINSNYFEGKTFNVTFKLRTAVVNPVTGDLKRFQPAYASLAIGKSLEPFKNTEFKCEEDGVCKGYSDNANFELLTLTLQKWLSPGPSITLTTTKGGADATFRLVEIVAMSQKEKEEMGEALLGFHKCLGDVMARMVADLDRLKK